MANVDRGQLILITGLVIAIGMVILTLLLNTAIYTENLASRGTEVGGQEAFEFRGTTINSIAEIIEEENEEKYDSRSKVRDNVSVSIDTYDQIQSLRYAELGRIGDVSSEVIHEGTTMRQTDSARDYTDNGGGHNWTPAQNVDGSRNFSLTVTGGLASTSDPETDAFHVSVIGSGGNEWSIYIYNDTLLGGRQLAVKNGSQPSPTEDVCSGLLPGSPPFTIDLTAGTVDGSACSAIEFGNGTTPPYDITYTWGNRSEGTYNLTVNTTTTNGFNNFGTSTSPFKIPIVYSVSLDVTYQNAQLKYRDRVLILPNEVP